MKIVTIIGARPQFVKAAVVSRAVANTDGIEEVLVHTGQHYDQNMSDIFFEEMEIPKPKYNLEVNGLSHGAMTGQMLEKIEQVLIEEAPDCVLVYGDTNSTIAGALAAKKMHIPVAHVEAGLRSFNMKMPEEVNRILTDRISDFLFTPTATAVKNLKAEGYDAIDTQIIQCGDVMYDASLFYAEKSAEKSTIKLPKENFILCTMHRAENTDDPKRLQEIVSALNKIHKETRIVLPLHPRTKSALQKNNLTLDVDLINPVGYFEMIELLKHCQLVVTDSGGVQKEAYFFGKKCVTLRDETEWTELVENGFNTLAGADQSAILKAVSESIGKPVDTSIKLYGNGDAGEQILQSLLRTIK